MQRKKLMRYGKTTMMGLITDNERYNQIIDIWTRMNTRITETLMKQLARRSTRL